ncbi:cytochrome c [soil metagenome]
MLDSMSRNASLLFPDTDQAMKIPAQAQAVSILNAARIVISALTCLSMLLAASPAQAAVAASAEPQLELKLGTQDKSISRSELLALPEIRTIDIPADSAYKRPMRYRALPLSTLVPLAQVDTLQFVANDGFVANISGKTLSGGAQPWIAIELPDAPWPPVKAGGPSAGAFYLVWLSPEKSGITPEQWPYQIAKIREVRSLEARYPQLVPSPEFPANSAERRGLRVHATSCAVCHQLNGGGDASVGPDLNKPYAPTEYFQDAFLRKLIRSSASVRNWPQRVMPDFPPAVLSEEELNDLLAYLRQMARQRP